MRIRNRSWTKRRARRLMFDSFWAIGIGLAGIAVFLVVLKSFGPNWLESYLPMVGMVLGSFSYLVVGGATVALVGFFGCFVLPDELDSRFCPMCEYDLTGNESGVCPECGQEVQRPRDDPSDR